MHVHSALVAKVIVQGPGSARRGGAAIELRWAEEDPRTAAIVSHMRAENPFELAADPFERGA
jgi:hypothetical protein